jgi:hypothetical protein
MRHLQTKSLLVKGRCLNQIIDLHVNETQPHNPRHVATSSRTAYYAAERLTVVFLNTREDSAEPAKPASSAMSVMRLRREAFIELRGLH